MRKKLTFKLLPFSLALLLTLAACAIPSGSPPPNPAPATATATSPSLPPAHELTLEMLRSATYTLTGFSDSPQTVTLVDGAYTSGSDTTAIGYISVHMGEVAAFGDLNGDGISDAAVVLGVNTGGTAVFTYIAAVLNVNGAPVHAASLLIDDRPQIGGLSIVSGEILAQTVVHRGDDPMCCPSLPVEQGFRLYNGNGLVLTRWAGQTADGQPRAINITSPADLATVNYPFTVTGNVTVGPFENTLAYNIYAPDNSLVTSGSVMTDSPDMGQPGNFSLSVDLTAAGVTGLVRIEFVEHSMMDGSVMTLDSVLVHVP